MREHVKTKEEMNSLQRSHTNDWLILYPFDVENQETCITLRDLICHVVLMESETGSHNYIGSGFDSGFAQMDARYRENCAGERESKFETGTSFDTYSAMSTALKTFSDGHYLVFVDGQHTQTLDSKLKLKPSSEVVFVRLSSLIGG